MPDLLLLLAQTAAQAHAHDSSLFSRVLLSIPWWAWIAIVAIISSCLGETFKAVLRHNERMALIRMGLHPDAPAEPPLPAEKRTYPEAAEL